MDEKCSCKCGLAIADIMVLSEKMITLLMEEDRALALKESSILPLVTDLEKSIDNASTLCGTSIPVVMLDRLRSDIKKDNFDEAITTTRFIGDLIWGDLKTCAQRK
jgi:hypothetical protein